VTPGTEHVNPNPPPQFTTFLSNVAPAQRETLGLKKILEGCPNCTCSTLMSHLETTNATCLRYHILGTCALSNCSKAHAPISIPPGGAAAICTALQPGLAATIASE
jgi:hypothetical protein